MNYKEKLKSILTQFNELKSSATSQIKQVRESDKYSVEYQRELIKEIKDKARVTQDKLCKEAIEIITGAKNEALKGKTSINKDQAFETKLSNALSILETIGNDMSIEELRELINPFKDDYYTMEILRKICLKKNINGVSELFGVNSIDKTIKVLNELAGYIAALTGDIESINLMKISIAINYIETI